MNQHRFTRFCSTLALIWLILSGVALEIFRPGLGDFPQFYMGGVIARYGAWADLYPIPTSDIHNPGETADSKLRPAYARLAAERGILECLRFIQPPQNALMYWPFGWFTFHQARLLWIVTSAILTWAIALHAAGIHREISGGIARIQGWLIVAIAFSPLALLSTRSGNISASIGLCIAVIVRDLIRPRANEAAIGLTIGTIAKYAPLVLLPLQLLQRRWRTLIIAASIAIAWTALTLAITGAQPLRVYWHEIRPALNRPFSQQGNQSIQGLLLRLSHRESLPTNIALAVNATGVLALLLPLLLLLGHRLRNRMISDVIIAGAVALLAWLLMFSPVYWLHYGLYLCPVLGWIWWQARSVPTRIASVAATLLLLMPVGGVSTHHWPELVGTSMLWATAIFYVLALVHLVRSKLR